jgi:tellurite resistance-related uncharacterized protein
MSNQNVRFLKPANTHTTRPQHQFRTVGQLTTSTGRLVTNIETLTNRAIARNTCK